MNFMITIAREKVGLTGYKTIEKLETVSRDAGLEKLEKMEIVRRFTNPFNASIEIVVVR